MHFIEYLSLNFEGGENYIFVVLERYSMKCMPLKVAASLHKTREGGGCLRKLLKGLAPALEFSGG